MTDPQTYSVRINGCDSMTVTLSNGGTHQTAYGFSRQNQDGEVEAEHTTDLGALSETVTVPFRAVGSFSGNDKSGYVSVTAAAPGIRDETDFPNSSGPAEQIADIQDLNREQFAHSLDNKSYYFDLPVGGSASVLQFSFPGTAPEALHMAKALQHLAEICKEHPEQAPKSMF